MALTAAEVWRDYSNIGIPASGPNQPAKRDIRAWGGYLETMLSGFQVGGGVVFTTRAQAYASLNYDAMKMAWVVLDPTPAFNGVYQKSGASGAGTWTKLANLPYSFYRAQNDGAGSASAIIATNDYPLASTDSLIVLNITSTNTASPVTVALNGGAPLRIRTSSGNDPVIGGLVAGMLISGYIDGTDFRLISDQASAAIQAAAESAAATAVDARDRAIEAADLAATVGAGDVPTIASVATAKLSSFIASRSYLLTAGWANHGDAPLQMYSRVASAPARGGFRSTDRFLPDGSTDATNGGWWVNNATEVDVAAFGAVGDGTTDDTAAIQEAMAFAAGKILKFTPGKTYFITDELTLSPNTLVFGNGAKLINTTSGIDFLNIAAGCVVLSLHATGTGTAGSTVADGFQHAYKFVGVSNAPDAPTFIDGVEIHNCHLTGFRGYAIFGQFVSNAKVTGCRIKDVGYAGIMLLSPLHAEIRSNLVDTVGPGIGASAYGISCTRETVPPLDTNITASPAPFDVLITQNTVLNNLIYTGYDIHAGNHNRVVDNSAINVHHGVNCTFDSPGTEVANTNIIAGNLLVGTYEGCGIRMGGQSSAGPTLITANANTIVEGNIIKHFGNEELELAAMHFFATSGVIARGNIIIEPEWGGINWYFLNDGFRCEGNTIVSVLGTTVTDPTFIRASSIGNRGYIGGNTLQFKPTLVPSSYNSVVGVAIADNNTNIIAFGRNEITLGGANNVTYNVGATVKVLSYPTRQVGYVDVALASAASSATASFDFPEFFSATSPPIFTSAQPMTSGIGSVRFGETSCPTVAYTGMTVLIATATGAVFGEDGTVHVKWEAEGF
jgi:hypothetical protein